MRRSILALMALLSAPAFAQADGGAEAPAPAPEPTPVAAEPAPAAASTTDLEAKLEAARREVKELREEMRAQFATQSVAQGWQEDWVEEKRKLELVTLNGYLRVRPELFYNYDLGRDPDPAGYSLFPQSPLSNIEKTQAGVNMRFRLEPTLNVSEEVRVRMQLDALDNLVWGSTPDYAYSRNGNDRYFYDRNEFDIFSQSQAAPRSGINSLQDSVTIKRVWGEVSTPVGILRFGRMGSHWGLGMLHNDGNGIDNDWGDTVDRLMFVAEPIAGIYVTPMLDFNVEGPLSTRMPEGGQPFDLSNSDDAHALVIAVARRDTETEARAKLDAGQTLFNYGVHFSYRWQRNDSVTSLTQPLSEDGSTPSGAATGTYVTRAANIFVPDLWAKLERKDWRIEAEASAILGNIQSRALTSPAPVGGTQSLDVWQFGAVLQGEYRLLNGDLTLGGEVGFASGDTAPGFGNYPRRAGSDRNAAGALTGNTAPGDIDGRQYACGTTGGCADNVIRNFRFNRDFRVDTILYRELLGGVTDSIYVTPKVNYRVTQGFNLFGSATYARAVFAESTPSANVRQPSAELGFELSAGARYETEDGFFAMLQYARFIPWDQGGFAQTVRGDANSFIKLEHAQVLRGALGVKF